MKFLHFGLGFCMLVSVNSAHSQSLKPSDKPTTNIDERLTAVGRKEHKCRTDLPASPSDVNVCGMPETGAERAGIRPISLKALPFVSAEERSCVAIKPDGSLNFSINPQFGELSNLTERKASELFGQDIRRGSDGSINFQTYQFCGQSIDNGSEMEIYHIDFEFKENGAISRYRIRCASLPKSDWLAVK